MAGTIQSALRLLGPRGFAGVLLSVVAGLIQSCAEVGVGLYLQAFLVSVGVADPSLLPSSLHWAAGLSAGTSALLLAGLGFVRGTGMFVTSQVNIWTAETISGRTRALALHSLVYPSGGLLAANSEAQFRQGELASRAAAFTGAVGGTLTQAVQATVFLTLMLVSAWQEAGVALMGVVVVALVIRSLQSGVRRVAARLPPLQRRYSAVLERVLRNRLFVTLLGMEKVEEDNLLVSLTNVQRANLRTQTAQNVFNAYTPFVGMCLVAGVVWTSQAVIGTKGLTLLTFLYLLFRFIQCGQAAVSSLIGAQLAWPHFEQALQFASEYSAEALSDANRYNASLPALGSSRLLTATTATTPERRPGPATPPRIEVRGVEFAYPGAEGPVLRGVSFTADAGAQLALVGPSGVGKSTLLLLLLGILKPSRGTVLLDGVEAADWRRTARPRLGYVGAEPFLIMGTLADNLNYGLPQPASFDSLVRALQFARLGEFATADSMQRTVGEDLQGLSAGQKQRLCLARAWLAEPDLLILDEATANVDEATESAIADALATLKGQCTTVLVTHRRGLLAHADQVLDMGALASPLL